MTKKGRQILFRIIGSILFLMLPILTSPNHSMDLVANLSNPQGQMDILLYALYLAFFYIHFEYLIPKFFFQERYVPYVGLIALSLLIVIFITNTILVFSPKRPPYSPSKMEQPNWEMEQPPPPNKIGITDKKDNEFMRPPKPPLYEPHDMEMSIWMQIARYLPMFLVVLFGSLAMRINNRWREVEQEKINSELSYLKAQINPHFLFNTLNSIYALAIEKSDETPEAITQLSSMMRYVLNDTNKDFVPLEKEIAYISNYIELQKMRFGDTLKLGEFNIQVQQITESLFSTKNCTGE